MGKLSEFEKIAEFDFEERFFRADLEQLQIDVEEIITVFWEKRVYEDSEQEDPLSVPDFL
jgi:hypothetical protein